MPENDFVIEDSRTTLEPALLKRALAATRDGVSIADAQLDDLPLIYVNSAFVSLTGYRAWDVLGKICGFLQHDK
jgi:PAS domain-containing protein